jgi:DNA-directed RNA polymerase subunit omega
MLTEPDSQSMLCSPGSALGNRFSLITLVRKRARNLVDGSPPLVETDSRNPVSVALEEIHHGKVRIRTAGSPGPERPDYKDPMTLQSEAVAFVLGV